MPVAAHLLRRAAAHERKAGSGQLSPDWPDGWGEDSSGDRDGKALGLPKQGPGSLRPAEREGGRRLLCSGIPPGCGHGCLSDPASAERSGDSESEAAGAATEDPHL